MAAYVTARELSQYAKDPAGATSDRLGQYEDAAEDASRAVDDWCHRSFDLAADVSARVFAAPCSGRFLIDDFSTTVGLVVKTDEGGDGTFETTWTLNTDYRVAPFNAVTDAGESAAYYELVPTGTRWWPVSRYGLPLVQVTAKWGWPAYPSRLVRATKIVGLRYVKLPDAALGVAGFDQFGSVRVQDIPDAVRLLRSLRREDRAGIA